MGAVGWSEGINNGIPLWLCSVTSGPSVVKVLKLTNLATSGTPDSVNALFFHFMRICAHLP
jgi:hypothetical protein